jgi:hypothetical protein
MVMDDEYYDDDNIDTYQDNSTDEFNYNQIALLIMEQKSEIGAIFQALQVIANSLPRELVDAEQ